VSILWPELLRPTLGLSGRREREGMGKQQEVPPSGDDFREPSRPEAVQGSVVGQDQRPASSGASQWEPSDRDALPLFKGAFTLELVALPLPPDWEMRASEARRLIVRCLERQALARRENAHIREAA